MTEAAVGLGSNLGDREAHLRSAVAGLHRLGSIRAVSSIYETAPVGGPPQGVFLNAVVIIGTALPAAEILGGILALERQAGRVRVAKWGPRTLDLDLLLYGTEVIAIEGLTVPHPRLAERRFVLEPLLEVRPAAALPGRGPVGALLAAVADQEVRRIDHPSWWE